MIVLSDEFTKMKLDDYNTSMGTTMDYLVVDHRSPPITNQIIFGFYFSCVI